MSEGLSPMERLPVEILENIFGYIDGKDVARCAQVCKIWNQVTASKYLWKDLCRREYPEELLFAEQSFDTDVNIYKECYMRAINSISKWKSNDYWELNITSVLDVFYIANGAIIGVIRLDGSIAIYDANVGPDAKELQRLKPFTHSVDPYWTKVHYGEKWVVLEGKEESAYCSTFFSYFWEKNRLHEAGAFHCVRKKGGDLDFVRGLGSPAFGVYMIGVSKESIMVFDRERGELYFYNGQNVTGKIKSSVKYYYENFFFVISEDTTHIIGFNEKGEKQITLENDILVQDSNIKMHFNKEIILVEFFEWRNVRKAVGWLWEKPGKRLRTIIETKHNLVLHPRYRHVCYISGKNKSVTDYEVITKALDTGELISIVPFSLQFRYQYFNPEISDVFKIIQQRFAMLRPIDGPSRYYTYYDNFLLDLVTGKIVFHLDCKVFDIKRSNNKMLESFKGYLGRGTYFLKIFT